MSIERYSIAGIILSTTIILLVLYLLKKRKISGDVFTRWFIIGISIGVISMFPAILTLLPVILGTEVLMSAVTLAFFIVLVLLIFYLDYRLNELEKKIMKLVVKISVDEYSSYKYDEQSRT